MPLRSVSVKWPGVVLSMFCATQLIRNDPDSLTNPSVVLPWPFHDPSSRLAGFAAGLSGVC